MKLLEIDNEKKIEKITCAIRANTIESKKDGAVLGFSGGIDSAVTLKLAKMALGKKNILALMLPEADSSKKTLVDAKRFIQEEGLRYKKRNISPHLLLAGVYTLFPPSVFFPKKIIKRYISEKQKNIEQRLNTDIYSAKIKNIKDPDIQKANAYHGIKNRLRMSLIYYYADFFNYIVLGCINKSEWLTGFFVKHGDSIADIMPLQSLYKTQVISIAKTLEIPGYILDKEPSSDLIPFLPDEKILGISYSKLDLILAGIEHGYSMEKLTHLADSDVSVIKRVMEIMKDTHKSRDSKIGSCD